MKSIMKYLKKVKEDEVTRFIYNHDSIMKVYIPKFYENRKFLVIDNDKSGIGFLGICKIEIVNKNNEEIEDELIMILPAILFTKPGNIDISDDKVYYIFEYEKGDYFLTNNVIIKNNIDLDNIFITFCVLGKKIPFLPYELLPYIMDNTVKLKGGLDSNRTCFELTFSELARSKKDLNKLYRLTNMKDDYELISMRNIVYAPKSITAKLLGNYFNDGLVSSLLVEGNDRDRPSKIESLLIS